MYDFNRHWHENAERKTPSQKKTIARNFLRPVFDRLDQSLGSQRILDAGCGDGVHAEILSERHTSVTFFGVDISIVALKLAQQKDLPQAEFQIANVSKLPYKDESFDISFSVGVLGYLDSPIQAFQELCRVTKKDGLVGVQVHQKRDDIMGLLWTATRKICNVFGPTVTKIIADCIVPFLGVLPTQSRMSLKNSTWKQCREIILVNIDPFILHCFRHSEVKNWFKNNDCEIVENLPSSPIAIWGESAKTFYSQE